jgi:hypothetical protein
MPTDYKLEFKSAFDYGVDPGQWTGNWTTSTDMTAAIQTALNDTAACPNGATLYFLRASTSARVRWFAVDRSTSGPTEPPLILGQRISHQVRARSSQPSRTAAW